MRFLRHRLAFNRSVIRRVYSAMALCFFAATVFQGMSFCLCKTQQQSCGDQCEESHSHPCHSDNGNDAQSTIDHDCIHIDFDVLPAISVANKTIPEISAALQFVYLDYFCGITDDLSIAVNISHPKTGQIPDSGPPNLIYISKNIKVLC